MHSNAIIPDPQLISNALTLLQKKFNANVSITESEFLSEERRRNIILRLHLNSSSAAVPASIILKQSLSVSSNSDDREAFARFARDWAGLEFASSIASTTQHAPRFYGSDHELRFILIEDLGRPHVSLVDSLLSDDAAQATCALARYASVLGSFHAASYNKTAEFTTLLKTINPAASQLQEIELTAKELLANLERTLSHEKIALPLTKEFVFEFNQIIDGIFMPGPFTVLAHGDIAPDNVFDNQKKESLQLIDFEWCGVRNALLDGTYLRMNIPTGWCAKKIPEEILTQLEQIYRNELCKNIPAARYENDKVYQLAYTQACGFHALMQITKILDCLEKDEPWNVGVENPYPLWNENTNLLRPRCISRLQTFVEIANKSNSFPAIRKTAQALLEKFKYLWPEAQPLDVYPAFKSQCDKELKSSSQLNHNKVKPERGPG